MKYVLIYCAVNDGLSIFNVSGKTYIDLIQDEKTGKWSWSEDRKTVNDLKSLQEWEKEDQHNSGGRMFILEIWEEV